MTSQPKGLRTVQRIPAAETRALVRAALEKADGQSSLNLESLRSGSGRRVRSLPSWVGRFGFLAGPDQFWLCCEPRACLGETFPSQFVLDVPPGRYFIEIFDAAASTWISRESAEGGPLVAGLPSTGNLLLVIVRSTPGG
jgi:hypothetical protein